LIKTLVGLIDVKYCDDRNDWLKLVCAMKKCKFTEQETKEWSMKSDRYTESGFDKVWEQYFTEEITATEGTIRYYAKLSNPTEYKKMTIKQFPTDSMDIQKLIKLKSDMVIRKERMQKLKQLRNCVQKRKRKQNVN